VPIQYFNANPSVLGRMLDHLAAMSHEEMAAWKAQAAEVAPQFYPVVLKEQYLSLFEQDA
jgi:hypothetical protein